MIQSQSYFLCIAFPIKTILMKRKAKVALHISSFRDFNGVLALANRVIQGMTDNAALFPNPDPLISKLEDSAERLSNRIAAAKNRDKQKIQDRNEESAFLLNELGVEGDYVDKIADGDRANILLSGFDASDDPSPRPAPVKVIIRRVEAGAEPHSAKVLIDAQPAGTVYTLQICPAPLNETDFKEIGQFTSSKKLVARDLERAKEYFFRVKGFNTRGEGEWSDPVVFLAQ